MITAPVRSASTKFPDTQTRINCSPIEKGTVCKKNWAFSALPPRWLLRELKFYIKEGIKRLFGQKLTDKVRKTRLH